MKKHETLMGKLNKKSLDKYELTDDSSDLDEFIPRVKFVH